MTFTRSHLRIYFSYNNFISFTFPCGDIFFPPHTLCVVYLVFHIHVCNIFLVRELHFEVTNGNDYNHSRPLGCMLVNVAADVHSSGRCQTTTFYIHIHRKDRGIHIYTGGTVKPPGTTRLQKQTLTLTRIQQPFPPNKHTQNFSKSHDKYSA